MKKVLIITPNFPPSKGGIQSLLWNVASNIKGLYIIVIAPHCIGDSDFDSKTHIRIIRTNPNRVLFLVQSLLYATLLLPDIVFCGHIVTVPVGLILRWFLNKPFVVSTYALEIMTRRRERIYSFFLRYANKIITISGFTKNRLVYLGVEKSSIEIIPPSVDTERFRPRIGTRLLKKRFSLDKKKILLTVGRMDREERYKGHDSVINILSYILKKHPEVVYLIVGDGDDMDRLRSLAIKNRLGENVIFTGKVTEEELPVYYNLCDLFVMPSKKISIKDSVKAEGFGIVFLEAGASCKPVIGGKSGGIIDVVVDRVTGILVEPDNPEELKNAVIELLEDASLRRSFGNNARKRIERKYSIEKIVENTEKLLLSVST